MKIGQAVVLYWPETEEKLPAKVVKIGKPGKSMAKTLDLKYTEGEEEMIAEGVHHFDDAVEGEPFWALKGVSVGRDWADVEVTDETPVPVLTPVEEPVPEKPKRAGKGKNK